MSDLITNVVASMIASGALAAALVWLTREWISIRLRTSIEHEYAQKLESLKAQLQAQNEVALVQLRAAIERQAGLLAAAHSSFAEGQKAAMERKLQAVDVLWARILHLRSNLPPILGFVDVLTVDEYKGMKEHKTFQTLSAGWTMERVTELVDGKVESVRPYIGEYVWAVFFSYQAVMLRIVYLMYEGRDDSNRLEWHKDSGTRQLVKAVLTAEEFAEFEATQFGKITWLRHRLESKVLQAARKLISGEEFGEDALEKARWIQQRAASLQKETT